jgi:hypothetical protein
MFFNKFTKVLRRIGPAIEPIPPPPPPPPDEPCIPPNEVAMFEGQPAVVNTWTGSIYTGIVHIFNDSDTQVALYYDGCCEQTLLDYCDIRSISPPPPCAVYAPACCVGCLPENVRLVFRDPTGTCADCAGEAVVVDLERVSQFGVYLYQINSNPFTPCGSADLKFTARFECDEDYEDWTLQLFWLDVENDIECKAEASVFIENCQTMDAVFNITINCDLVCKGMFTVYVST